MGSYSRRSKSFRRPGLPAGATIHYGSNKIIHEAMANNVQTVCRPIAPYSQHTTTGELATPSTSAHWAITLEPVSPVRQEVEYRQATYDQRSYRTVRADVLHTSPEWQAGRQLAKANRYRKAQQS